MGIVYPRRAAYRVRQFAQAVRSYWAGITPQQQAVIEAVLPPKAQALYRSMGLPDQQHSLRVVMALRAQGFEDRALLQAAILHDVAKHRGGVRLWHRVAVVLIKAFRPQVWQQWSAAGEPPSRRALRPFWAHAHHPDLGARMAREAECDPLAVALIAHHQNGVVSNEHEARLLAALRAADDDN